jgi:hypothetical protein
MMEMARDDGDGDGRQGRLFFWCLPKLMPTTTEINEIFEQNELDDLKRFIAQRQCLNVSNTAMMYLFHIVQASGILTTAIAAGYQNEGLIWVGVGLNTLATLVSVFEKTNETISKRLFKGIQAIKAGAYVDEETIEFESEKKTTPLLEKAEV